MARKSLVGVVADELLDRIVAGEFPPGAGAGHDARLIGKILGRRVPVAGQPGREEESDEAKNEDRDEENEQGKVIAQHGTRLV